MIRFSLKAKRRQHVVLGRHLIGAQAHRQTCDLSKSLLRKELTMADGSIADTFLNSQKNLHPHCPCQVLHSTTSAPMMKAFCQVLPPMTSALMTNAIKMKRVTAMLHQKIAKPKNLDDLEINLERCHKPNIDDLPLDKKFCPNCTKRTTFLPKISSMTQFETFCLSTFDLPQCLYLFPMSCPCIS
jgi:hypothetical protein